MNDVEKTMRDFAEKVVREAKRKAPKNSRRLRDSIKYDLTVYESGVFQMEFFMEEYGLFRDAGVSGTRVKYNTRFAYRDKMPSFTRDILPWVKTKRFQFRDSRGRFTSYRTVAYLIARSIKKRGFKPSLFFTRPFERFFADLPDDVVQAYGLELDRTFDAWLTEVNYTGPNKTIKVRNR